MHCYILHIETATKVCSVALSDRGKLLAVKESDDSSYVHGEMITLFIQDVLKEAGISSAELAAISVTSGPGSYTGLRIGVSTAKGLCYALNIPLIAIDALKNLELLARETYPNDTIVSMIDARRMEVFSSIYDSSGDSLKAISADILDENSYSDFEPFTVIGDGTSKMIDVWSSRSLKLDTTIQSSARGHVALAYKKFQNSDFEDVAYFEPFYLKDFVSTVKK